MSSDFIYFKIKTKVFGHKHELSCKLIKLLLRTFTNGNCQLNLGRQKYLSLDQNFGAYFFQPMKFETSFHQIRSLNKNIFAGMYNFKGSTYL